MVITQREFAAAIKQINAEFAKINKELAALKEAQSKPAPKKVVKSA